MWTLWFHDDMLAFAREPTHPTQVSYKRIHDLIDFMQLEPRS
ncbi:hypothetical protein LMG33818_001076 [Halomonadaceae bacterium LMG 33818]